MILKMDLRDVGGLDETGLGEGQMVDFCEHGDEYFYFIKAGYFFGQLSTY